MNYNYINLPPFKWFILQNFPFIEADFDAITNWQLFCKLGEEINKIINSNNLTGQQVENLTNAFNELQNYVNDYFENLDIQDEINNKLDEMAESGELTEIISLYLETNCIFGFDTVDDMRNADNLADGSIAYCLSNLSLSDGKGNFYKIRTITSSDIVDNINIIALINYNNLIAELIPNRHLNYYYVKTTDSFNTIQSYFNDENAKVIEFENGTYTFTDTFRLTKNTKILLNNSNLIFNIPKVTEDWENSHGFFNFKDDDTLLSYSGNGNIEVIGGTITHGNFSLCHANNITFKNINFELCNNDHVLEMCAINGLTVENCTFNGQCQSNVNNYKEIIQIENAVYENFPFFDSEDNLSYDNTPCKNINIKNNVFTNPNVTDYTLECCFGSHSYIDNVYHENINIENNTFNNSSNLSIQLYNAKNVNIFNNQFICNNTDAITNEGCHIRTRNSIININIYNNSFIGNARAIETASPNVLLNNKNINIMNNNFSNYVTSLINYSIINIYSCDFTNISSNNFKNFNMGIIRINGNNETVGNKTVIKNNVFISDNTITSGNSTIKIYDGISEILNNEFNISNADEGYRCLMLSSDSDTCYAKNNSFNELMVTTNRCVDFTTYDKDRKTVENLKPIWEGNSTSLSNVTTNNDYRNYTHLIITLGTGAGTYSYFLSGWSSGQPYISYRGFNLPVENSVVYLYLNQDGTIGYSDNNTTIPIRSIKGLNDLSI